MVKRNGKTRSILLTPDQDARMDRLIGDTGLNRNKLVRLMAEKMTPEDVKELNGRPLTQPPTRFQLPTR